MFALLPVGLVLLTVLYWYLRKRTLECKTANIPSMPGELPLIGHSRLLSGDDVDVWDFFKSIGHTTNELGGITKIWLGPCLYVFVTEPKLVKELLNTVLDKSDYYDASKRWLGQGLVTSDVPTWKRHRKLLNPTFNQQMLNGFLSVMNKEAAHLVEKLEQKVGKGEFDVFPFTNEQSLETVMKTALGFDQPSDFIKEYGKMVEIMFRVGRIKFQYVWMIIDFLYYWTGTKRMEDKAIQKLNEMSTTVINKKKASYNSLATENNCKTILDVLIGHESNGSLNQLEVREEVDTIITAGSDTTATTIVYLLIMLGSYPEIQEKVWSEVHKLFGSSNRDVTKDDIPLLVYTEAVIKETLRIHPIVPIVSRAPRNGDVKCGNYTIPNNTNIYINIYGIHMGAEWGDDADLFRPERWLTPGGVPDLTSCYAPFSLGRRSCIGMTYAMMSMKVTLVQLIRRYKVMADDTKLKSRWNTLLKPNSGSEISIELR